MVADGKWVRRIARTAAGRRGCKGVAIEMGEEKKPLVMSELGCADLAADGKWVRRIVRTAADGVGAIGSGWKWMGRRSRWS